MSEVKAIEIIKGMFLILCALPMAPIIRYRLSTGWHPLDKWGYEHEVITNRMWSSCIRLGVQYLRGNWRKP